MKIAKLIPVLLCFSLALSACGGASESDAEASGNGVTATSTATGRYLEEKVDFPSYTQIFAIEQTAPDTYYVLGKQGDDAPQVCRSEDGGATWRTTEHADLSGYEVISGGGFAPDGSFYVSYAESDAADPETPIFHTAHVDENSVTVVDDIPELSEYVMGMTLTDSGDLLLDNSFSFTQVDVETGATEQYDLTEGQSFSGNYVVYGDKLAVFEGPHISVFDMASGEVETIKLSTQSGVGSVLAVQEDESGFFYCNRDGLYRVTMDGAITEQLIDGTLAGFGNPSAYLMKLFACQDGSFLVLTEEQGSYQMVRYVFDPNAAREPASELAVFSLRDDVYIRQVISKYQQENPEVMVRLQVGLPENTNLTTNDAIRTLSTELLAGSGPDLFVMDGLPIDSYIQKNALADLTPALESVKPELLPSVVSAYADGDSLYAIPTRVSMPLLAGIGIESIGNLHELVAWLETQPEQELGIPANLLMQELYPILAAGWFDGDGALNIDALTSDLTDLRLLAERIGDSELNLSDITSQSMFWSGEGLPVIFGKLSMLEDAAYITSAFTVRSGGTIKPFGSGLIPRSVLAVNATGVQAETALDFVRFALEAGTQTSLYNAGMQVNMTALETVAGSMDPGEFVSSGGLGFSGMEKSYKLDIYWPTADQMDSIIGMISSATILAQNDEIVRQMLMEETEGLLSGDKTVDEVVADLGEKVERYLQE